MTYKKRSNDMKGVYLTWNNECVFPEYKYNSGPTVSTKMLFLMGLNINIKYLKKIFY